MVLVAVNVAVFVAVLVGTQEPGAITGAVTDAHLRFGLSRDVLATEVLWQADDGSIFVTQPDEWYRLVTSGFMHFGILHLGLNMYFLWVLGPMLERPLGRGRYFLLYLASLLAGSLGVVLLDSGGITAGASGAVFGLMGAAAVGLWRRGVNPFSTNIGTLLLLNLGITFLVPGISIGGHLGGALGGALCAVVMLAPGHKALPMWAQWATPIAVAVGSVALSVAVVGAT